MYESLNLTLGALPDETRILLRHEYTVNNLRFAESLDRKIPEFRRNWRGQAARAKASRRCRARCAKSG